MSSWNDKFIGLAKHIAGWSKDKSKKVGAVIVDNDNRIISLGYNGFPRGIDDNIKERHERPIKYTYTCHAEQNAIFNAAANGHPLKGASIYSTFHPCSDCSRAIIQSGIVKVVTSSQDIQNPRWKDDFSISEKMLTEAGVIIELFNG